MNGPRSPLLGREKRASWRRPRRRDASVSIAKGCLAGARTGWSGIVSSISFARSIDSMFGNWGISSTRFGIVHPAPPMHNCLGINGHTAARQGDFHEVLITWRVSEFIRLYRAKSYVGSQRNAESVKSTGRARVFQQRRHSCTTTLTRPSIWVLSHSTTLMAGASSDHGNTLSWAAPPTKTQACFVESRRMVCSGIDFSGVLIWSPYIGAEQYWPRHFIFRQMRPLVLPGAVLSLFGVPIPTRG